MARRPVLQALPSQNSGAAVAGTIVEAAGGAPGWVATLDTTVAGGQATDPNSAPLVALMALALLAGRRRAMSPSG